MYVTIIIKETMNLRGNGAWEGLEGKSMRGFGKWKKKKEVM